MENELDELQNPDNLSPEQYGAADGWRLLKRSEIGRYEVSEHVEMLGCNGQWSSFWCGNSPTRTYRTRLSVVELAALRAKGAE